MTEKIDLSGLPVFITGNQGCDIFDICKGLGCKETRAYVELRKLKKDGFLFKQTRGQIAYYYSNAYAEKHNVAEFIGCKPKPRKPYTPPIPTCGVSVLSDMLKLNKRWPARS